MENEVGLQQVYALSPFLYILIMDVIIEETKEISHEQHCLLMTSLYILSPRTALKREWKNRGDDLRTQNLNLARQRLNICHQKIRAKERVKLKNYSRTDFTELRVVTTF